VCPLQRLGDLTGNYEVWQDCGVGYQVGQPFGCQHVCPAGYSALIDVSTRAFGCEPCEVDTYKPAVSTATA